MTTRELTGLEMAATGCPPGWTIIGRAPDRDIYIIAEDTPFTHAVRQLKTIKAISEAAIDVLEGANDESHW